MRRTMDPLRAFDRVVVDAARGSLDVSILAPLVDRVLIVAIGRHEKAGHPRRGLVIEPSKLLGFVLNESA